MQLSTATKMMFLRRLSKNRILADSDKNQEIKDCCLLPRNLRYF